MGVLGAIRARVERAIGPTFRAERRLRLERESGEPEIELLELFADPGADFLDIGANDGVYSYLATKNFRRVYALEPHPAHQADLRAILGDKGTLIAAGASDQAGEAALHIPMQGGRDVDTRSSLESHANPGFETRRLKVPLVRIDDIDVGQTAVLKADVEGHELAAIRGAQGLLRRRRPIAIVECEERHNAGGVAALFGLFQSLQFSAYFLHRGRLAEGTAFDLARHQRVDLAKPVGSARDPDYVNNFIFVPNERTQAVDALRRRFP